MRYLKPSVATSENTSIVTRLRVLLKHLLPERVYRFYASLLCAIFDIFVKALSDWVTVPKTRDMCIRRRRVRAAEIRSVDDPT